MHNDLADHNDNKSHLDSEFHVAAFLLSEDPTRLDSKPHHELYQFPSASCTIWLCCFHQKQRLLESAQPFFEQDIFSRCEQTKKEWRTLSKQLLLSRGAGCSEPLGCWSCQRRTVLSPTSKRKQKTCLGGGWKLLQRDNGHVSEVCSGKLSPMGHKSSSSFNLSRITNGEILVGPSFLLRRILQSMRLVLDWSDFG